MTFDELITLDTFTFDVTQDDIDGATKCCSTHCPIARAINRTMELKYGSASVLGTNYCHPISIARSIRTHPFDRNYLSFLHSTESEQFVKDFDNDRPIKPTTLTIKKAYT